MANQVLVEELAVTMELETKGIMLRVNTDGRLRGYIQIGKGKLKWFRGKEQTPSGEMTLESFIEFAEKKS